MISAVAVDLRIVNVTALAACLAQRAQREFWRGYVADTLWALARGMFGKYDVPAYSQSISGAQHKDERSGEEIIEHLLNDVFA